MSITFKIVHCSIYICNKTKLEVKQAILLFLLSATFPVLLFAQKPDTVSRNKDSALKQPPVILNSVVDSSWIKLIAENDFLNSTGVPVTMSEALKKEKSKDSIFYLLTGLFLLLGLLRFFFSRYFSNLFRVFFNTSMRQSQLTDQLLQAKLPSLFFNLFFILISSWYLYLVLNFFGEIKHYTKWQVLLICAMSLAMIYLVKFSILKFTGWITGYKQEADTYIFIVFLINKIVAICLMPLIIIIAFSENDLAYIALILSFVIICLMLLMRFFRSYSLLQNRLKVSRFHFFVYIIGIEIVPLLVIYKVALLFMSKNL